jgi:hypothetical protein
VQRGHVHVEDVAPMILLRRRGAADGLEGIDRNSDIEESSTSSHGHVE